MRQILLAAEIGRFGTDQGRLSTQSKNNKHK